jgi:two-component system chemotaxis family response regulator WspR
VFDAWGVAAAVVALAVAVCGWLVGQVTHLRSRLKEVLSALEARTTDLERARLQIQRLSTEDDLTALANHDQLLEFLQREWRRARREASPLSLVVADVDDFRAYNRQYGRRAGDECLRELVARYHRDQFAVALAATEPPGAHAIAERLRRAVESLGVPAAKSASAAVITVSVGVSTIVPPRDSALEELDLVKAARHALRHARESGGNRVSHSHVAEAIVAVPERVSP